MPYLLILLLHNEQQMHVGRRVNQSRSVAIHNQTGHRKVTTALLAVARSLFPSLLALLLADRRGVHATPSATVTTDTANAPQSSDHALPAAITLTDMLTAGSDGLLTPYDGAENPCEMSDCPYVASIVAGEFMALCCYDCALYHAHSCLRTRFPSYVRAQGSALPARVDESGECEDDDTDAIAAAVAASITFDTPPNSQPSYPGGLLTAAQLAGMARQPGQSASNAEVCDITADITASLTDLQSPDPEAANEPAELHGHDSFTVRMTETKVWTTAIAAASAEEARRKAERTTRGWQAESDTLVVEAATDADTEARSEVE